MFEFEGYQFRKVIGDGFPHKDKQVIYSVHWMTGGIKLFIVIDYLMGQHIRIKYFHEPDVKQCLFEAVNQFEKSYLRLVFSEWMK